MVSAGERIPSLRSRVISGEVLIGTFATMGSSTSAEICARSGFDWVMVDLEHGLGTEEALVEQLRAIDSAGTGAIVRVEANSRLRCSRALDQGATGIMIPRIESVADATTAVSFLRYPPAGTRGVALSTRSSGYGTLSHEEMVLRNDIVVCLIQIETLSGLRDVRDIAAVDGVDVLFVGPTDLTHSLGIPGDLSHPDYRAALTEVAAAARASGRACGIMLQSVDEVDAYVELGFTFLAIGSDSGLLAGTCSQITNQLRARTANLISATGTRDGSIVHAR